MEYTGVAESDKIEVTEHTCMLHFSNAGPPNPLHCSGISLMVQWLRLCASNAGGEGFILGQEAKVPCLRAKKPKHKTEAVL